MRKGMLKGSGKSGYYNWIPTDPKVHGDSALGIKQPQAISPMLTKVPPQVKKAEKMWGFAKEPFLTEAQINLVKNRMNHGKITEEQFWEMREGLPIGITPEQSRKGLEWLKNLYLTPFGAFRKRNPFNSAHIHVIENYSHFTIEEFEDTSQDWDWHFFMPIYKIYARDGSYFKYRKDASREPPIKIIETDMQPEP